MSAPEASFFSHSRHCIDQAVALKTPAAGRLTRIKARKGVSRFASPWPKPDGSVPVIDARSRAPLPRPLPVTRSLGDNPDAGRREEETHGNPPR